MKTKSILIATAVMAAAVSQADTYSAVTNGSIFANTTWSSGFAPVAGDTNTWSTAGFSPNMGAGMATNSFHGQTLKVTSASVFSAGVAVPVLTLRNLVLDAGGTMQMGNNGSWNVYFGTNNTFTLNGGTLKHSQGSTTGRSIIFHDGMLAGSGSINITSGTADATGSVKFEETINTTGFTGAFTVSSSGRLNLPTITNATFNLFVEGTGKLLNNTDIAVKQLGLGGEYIGVGTYAYDDFTPAQQAFLVNTNGSITVTVPPPETGVVYAVAGGNITTTNVWGGVAPVAGDVNTWRATNFIVNVSGAGDVFYGQTLEIATGSTFRNGGANATADTVRNLTLNGGIIDHANNLGWNLSLGGNTFTLNSGTVRINQGAIRGTIQIRNANLAGSGTIEVLSGTPTNSLTIGFELANTVNTTNFTGLFDVKQYGRLNLSPITTNNASFGLILSGTGKLINDANIALASLTLGTDAIAKGTYTAAGLVASNAAYAAFFTAPANDVLTITVVNDPPVEDPYGDWAADNGVTGGMTDDDDLDGMENLLEYALGGNPQVDDAAAFLPAAKLVGANMQYIYNRRIDAEDRNLEYGLILNSDLVYGSWSNIGTSAETGSAALNAEFEAVTNLVSTAEGKKFINLEVIQN